MRIQTQDKLKHKHLISVMIEQRTEQIFVAQILYAAPVPTLHQANFYQTNKS
jgi:hypothetical protein